MMKSCITALAVLVGTAAMAAEPWEGIWAPDPDWCQFKNLIGEHDPAPIRITAAEVAGLESSCEITGVTSLGVEGAWKIDQFCSGEGSTWTILELMMVDAEDRLIRFDQHRYAQVLTRCD